MNVMLLLHKTNFCLTLIWSWSQLQFFFSGTGANLRNYYHTGSATLVNTVCFFTPINTICLQMFRHHYILAYVTVSTFAYCETARKTFLFICFLSRILWDELTDVFIVTSSVADPDPHLKRPPGSAWRDPDPGG